jgi:hypothetical protein
MASTIDRPRTVRKSGTPVSMTTPLLSSIVSVVSRTTMASNDGTAASSPRM